MVGATSPGQRRGVSFDGPLDLSNLAIVRQLRSVLERHGFTGTAVIDVLRTELPVAKAHLRGDKNLKQLDLVQLDDDHATLSGTGYRLSVRRRDRASSGSSCPAPGPARTGSRSNPVTQWLPCSRRDRSVAAYVGGWRRLLACS